MGIRTSQKCKHVNGSTVHKACRAKGKNCEMMVGNQNSSTCNEKEREKVKRQS